MGQKIATTFYVVIQCFFAACAVAVISGSSWAVFMVAYYTLSVSSWKIINVVFCQKNPDKKGVLDL